MKYDNVEDFISEALRQGRFDIEDLPEEVLEEMKRWTPPAERTEIDRLHEADLEEQRRHE